MVQRDIFCDDGRCFDRECKTPWQEVRNHFGLFFDFTLQDGVESISGGSFDPGLVTAFLQQDEPEVFYDARQRALNSLGRMGIMVAMDR